MQDKGFLQPSLKRTANVYRSRQVPTCTSKLQFVTQGLGKHCHILARHGRRCMLKLPGLPVWSCRQFHKECISVL